MRTAWLTAENPAGEAGAGGRANGGREGRLCIFGLKAGQQAVLADLAGQSGMIRRIWATISDRSPAMLRGLKIEMFY